MVSIEKILYDKISSDENLKDYKKDLGLALVSQEVDFKIKETERILLNEIREQYNPTSTFYALVNLLYRVGYIRFKKPLNVNVDIFSNRYTYIKKYSRFTDGKNVYISTKDNIVQENSLTTVDVECSEIFKKNITIDNGVLYSYFDTKIHFTEFVRCEIFKNSTEVKYSQHFIDDSADYSIEVSADGIVRIVFRLNNENGLELTIGDKLDINTFLSYDNSELPKSLQIIEDGYDLKIDNISLSENYESMPNLDEMLSMVKYGRKNIGDLCVNEDYRQFIKKNVSGIKILKVWQEREENAEVGSDVSNINKVFCSYLLNDETTNDSEVNKKIVDTIQKGIYGKECIVKPSEIRDLVLNITISTDESYSKSLQDLIRSSLIDYYDNVYSKISKEIAYKKVFKVLIDNLEYFELSVLMSELGELFNPTIFRITSDNILISFKGL
jgi:hypothetical protein